MTVREIEEDTGRVARTRGPLRTMAAVEREHILQVLASTAGDRLEAARILGLSREALYRKLLIYSRSARPAIQWRDD